MILLAGIYYPEGYIFLVTFSCPKHQDADIAPPVEDGTGSTSPLLDLLRDSRLGGWIDAVGTGVDWGGGVKSQVVNVFDKLEV